MDKQILKVAKNTKKEIRQKYKTLLEDATNRAERRKIKEDEAKEYNERIYNLYGKEIYLKIIPSSIRKKDIKKLKSEGKFIEIENKHFSDSQIREKYNHKLIDLHVQAMKKEGVSSFKVGWYKVSNYFKYHILPISLATASALYLEGSTLAISNTEAKVKKNAKEYKDEIEDYNNKIDSYAENIKKLKLTELETLMIVMDDMWKNIQGYGEPKKDITGYLGLDLATDDGVGVCRNMADDVARKLNAINPNYNAVSISGYAQFNEGLQLADIDRKEVKTEDTVEQESKNEILENAFCRIFGNHAVVLLKSQKYDANLIIDPTNPSIGICYNGNIEIINSNTKDGYTLDYTLQGDKVLNGLQSYDNAFDIGKNAFKMSSKEFEKIKNEYSIENQNKALEYTRKLRTLSEFDRQLVISAHQVDSSVQGVTYNSSNKCKEKTDDDLTR